MYTREYGFFRARRCLLNTHAHATNLPRMTRQKGTSRKAQRTCGGRVGRPAQLVRQLLVPQTLSKPHTAGESQVCCYDSAASCCCRRCCRARSCSSLQPLREIGKRVPHLLQSTTYPFDSSAGGTSCHRPEPPGGVVGPFHRCEQVVPAQCVSNHTVEDECKDAAMSCTACSWSMRS